MREIKFIVIHCTATPPTATVENIQRYWKNVLGWKNPGYHILIDAKGNSTYLQPFDKIANGVAGQNEHSLHISYIGGISKTFAPLDTRTIQQKATMLKHLIELKELFPNAKILGHRDFPGVKKACPSFDVKEWIKIYKL